jgi:hypothetical protein
LKGAAKSREAPSSPSSRTALDRVIGLATATLTLLCLGLAAVQLGWLPGLDHAWAMNLWLYLPPPLAYGLAGGVVLLGVPAARRALLLGLGRLPLNDRVGWALLLALPLVLWPLRERLAFGDSRIIYFTMNTNPATFFFPDMGATFFLQMGHRIGEALGIGGLELVQGTICLMAPLATYCFWRASLLLAPSPHGASIVLGLILGNAILRIFAGHLEVYSFVLVTIGAYLWASLAYLDDRCSWRMPALAFGIGLWVHVQLLFLAPSLMLLFVSKEPGRRVGHYLMQWMKAAAITLLPSITFFALLLLAGQEQDLRDAFDKLIRWSDVGPTPGGHEAWVRFLGESGAGTRYRIFGHGHFKYLINAFFLIAPFGLLIVATFALAAPRLLVSTGRVRFLSSACATTLVYAAIVRPVYGPYDWDLFSATAVLVSALAGHLLVREVRDPPLRDIAVLAVGAGLLFTAIPMLIIGVAPSRDAGPFSRDLAKPVHGEPFDESFERQIAPWL